MSRVGFLLHTPRKKVPKPPLRALWRLIEHSITFNDAKFVVEESEKYSLKHSNKIEDFEDNLRLSKEYQDILIEFCRTK